MNYKILSKYIKDVSFEIPNFPTFTSLEQEITNYNLKFDIKSKALKNNIIEVNTILKLDPNDKVINKMLTEINYSTIISIENTKDKKLIEKIILIEVPTMIYPSIYETFIYLFSQAGIKNLTIEKSVDFEKLYNERKKS
jgi:preprotein translocase subunit SecB